MTTNGDDDPIVIIDRERFEKLRTLVGLNRAGADRGTVCKACSSILSAADQALLLLAGEEFLAQHAELERLREFKGRYLSGMEAFEWASNAAKALREAGLIPFPDPPLSPPSPN